MRIWTLSILLFIFNQSFTQLKITDVGDGWKVKVEQALDTIKKYDTIKYNVIISKCLNVGYWNNSFATTEPPSTILIPTKEMNFGNIYNISAILVHESFHLLKCNNTINENEEEYFAYNYELNYLNKIPKVDSWLIENARNKIKFYSTP